MYLYRCLYAYLEEPNHNLDLDPVLTSMVLLYVHVGSACLIIKGTINFTESCYRILSGPAEKKVYAILIIRHDLWCLRLAARTYESPGLEALGTDDVERLGNGEMYLVGRTA